MLQYRNPYLGYGVTKAVSHQCVTMEAQIQPQSSPYGICDEQCGTGAWFSV